MKINILYFEDSAIGNALRRELISEKDNISKEDIMNLKIDINGDKSSKYVLEKLGCSNVPSVGEMEIEIYKKFIYLRSHEYDYLKEFM